MVKFPIIVCFLDEKDQCRLRRICADCTYPVYAFWFTCSHRLVDYLHFLSVFHHWHYIRYLRGFSNLCSVMLFYCSPLAVSGVRVTRSIVLCVCFVDRCLSFCPFSFGHCVVCPSSNYGFWLSLLYLKAPLIVVWYKWLLSTWFYLFSLEILLSIMTVKSINFSSQYITLSCARENWWDNQEWTIQGYWKRWPYNTQDK